VAYQHTISPFQYYSLDFVRLTTVRLSPAGKLKVKRQHNILVKFRLSILFGNNYGKRNKHGIPLPELLIFGKTGQREVKDWIKEWLK
jgi:hypothetical protein